MKHAVNFRLSPQSISMLDQLADKLTLSKTEVVERALLRYYQRKRKNTVSPLLQFAGKLSDSEADSMLEAIESSKHNKDEDIEL